MKCWDGVTYKIYGVISILLLIMGLSACDDNELPVAEAGNQIDVTLGNSVELNGSYSYDPDGTIKDYQWVISIAPDGSLAKIKSATSVLASFVPDAPGVYVVELIVIDSKNGSARDHVFINVKSDIAASPSLNPPVSGSTTPVIMPPGVHPPSVVTPPHVTPIPDVMPPPIFPVPVGPPLIILVGEEFELVPTSPPQLQESIAWKIGFQQPKDAAIEIARNNDNEWIFTTDTPGHYFVQELTSAGIFAHYDIQVVDNRISLGDDRVVPINNPVRISIGYFMTIPPANPTENVELIRIPEGSEATLDSSESFRYMLTADIEGEYEIHASVTLDDGSVWEDSLIYTASNDFDFINGHQMFQFNCVECHNGLNATGKSASHLATTDMCEFCHTIVSWVPALVVDHTQVIGACTDCHNGVTAMGRSVSHIQTTDACEACHTTYQFVPIIRVDHEQTIGDCVSCHNGIVAIGKSISHPDTSDSCEECHNSMTWITEIDTSSDVAQAPLDIPEVSFTLEANQTSVDLGDPVILTAEFTNTSDIPVYVYRFTNDIQPIRAEVSSNSLKPISLSPMKDQDLPLNDPPASNIITLLPGESIKQDFIWTQSNPIGGLLRADTYNLRAHILVLETGSLRRQELSQSLQVQVIQPRNLISDEEAILNALQSPTVMTWYESKAKDIMCRFENKIINVLDYGLAPVDTSVPISDVDMNCKTLLLKTTNYEWNVLFFDKNDTNDFNQIVVLDALTGEIKESITP